jgi:hypothetical protein
MIKNSFQKAMSFKTLVFTIKNKENNKAFNIDMSKKSNFRTPYY